MGQKSIVRKKLAKILKSLDPGDERCAPQEYVLMWFGRPSKFEQTVRRAKDFAERHGCVLLFPEWSREAATFLRPDW